MPLALLVPLDGSTLAERALPFAASLARATRGRLLLLRVTVAEASSPLAWEEDPADSLNAVADRLRAEGLGAEATVYDAAHEPDVAAAICETAFRRRVDLIAMSTHGRGGLGRWIYGSVADQVLRQAQTPVLLVPAIGERHWPEDGLRRILVCLDGSPLADAVLVPARQLAAALGAEVVLLRVVEPVVPAHDAYATALLQTDLDTRAAAVEQELQQTAEPLRAVGPSVRVVVRIGEPAITIGRVAREEAASMVALGTRGRSGLARLVLGSVATGVVQRSDVPLLLVPSAALSRPPEAPSAAPARSVPTVMVGLTPLELHAVRRGLHMLAQDPDTAPQQAAVVRDLLDKLERPQPGTDTSGLSG